MISVLKASMRPRGRALHMSVVLTPNTALVSVQKNKRVSGNKNYHGLSTGSWLPG